MHKCHTQTQPLLVSFSTGSLWSTRGKILHIEPSVIVQLDSNSAWALGPSSSQRGTGQHGLWALEALSLASIPMCSGHLKHYAGGGRVWSTLSMSGMNCLLFDP